MSRIGLSMTVARLTARRTRLERNGMEAIGMLLDGASQAEVGRKYKVTESAVSQFVDRHAQQLADMRSAVNKGAEDYMIAHKVDRIRLRDFLRSQLLEVRKARAKGDTGEETGLVVKTYKQIGNGRNVQLVEEWKIDPALVNLIETLQHATAEELGQLPKSGDVNLNIDNRTQILVREVLKDG